MSLELVFFVQYIVLPVLFLVYSLLRTNRKNQDWVAPTLIFESILPDPVDRMPVPDTLGMPY